MSRHETGEHGGLSIGIATAAKALKNKLNIIGLRLKALRHKFKFMPTDAELCLLICSMFPENFGIPIEDLVMYGMGLNLFKDVRDMIGARDRIYHLIDIINGLKYPRKVIGDKIRLAYEKDGSCNQNVVKMSVAAHDLAKSIGSSYALVFHRETIMEKWLESSQYQDCYGLSLVLKKINNYPIKLKFLKLALLKLQYEEDSQSIPVDFFEGMKELRVLSLDIPSLPRSLTVLRNLRTLSLKVQKLEDMSWIGGLTNLEFLSISTLSLTHIPREMGQLEKLRSLDLRKMNLAYISPGVLSRMLKLEELYFPLGFNRWGCKAKEYDDYDEWELREEEDEERTNTDDGEIINASLVEIVSPMLKALEISIHKASVLLNKSPVLKNIKQFKVHMQHYIKVQPFGKDSSNELHLMGDACDIKESGICNLINRTESLSLIRVRKLKSVIHELENDDFPLLKKMIISECEELECIIDATEKQISVENNYLFWKLESLHLSMLHSLKEICIERCQTFQWFQNLSEISIRFCHKLNYVFPMSIFKRTRQFKSIEILDCNEMEGVFYDDEEVSAPLVFGSIEKLDLHSLPKLIGFLVRKDTIIDGNQSLATNEILSNCMERSISSFDGNFNLFAPNRSTSTLQESHIEDEELICPLLTDKPKLQKGVVTQQLVYSKQVSLVENKDVISAMENKDVISPMEMYCLFSSELWLQNLKRLKIAFCDSIRILFLFEESHATSRAYNYLEELELHGLRNLVHVWFQIPRHIMAFQNLQLLILSECQNLYLFSPQIVKLLVRLQKVYISRCEKMEEILAKGDEKEAITEIIFPQLKHLELQYMPNLKIFYSGIYKVEFPLLDSLKFNQCNKMKSFSYWLSSTPMLKKVEINGSLYSLKGDINTIMKGASDTSPSLEDTRMFTFAELKTATKDFRPDAVLGDGGFGKVYKGWLDEKTFSPSKMPVAIKRLNTEGPQGFQEWQVILIGRFAHPSLVKLLGYCAEDKELLLVYEFIQKGSLDSLLFGRNSTNEMLSWDMRIKIAIQVAWGLHFLHTSEYKVIHRNIKPSNILLDGNHNAKISDFGLGVLGPLYGDSHMSTQFMGTYGYADPEYVATGHFCIKSDVYSFGVVLLEMMTSLRAVDANRPMGQVNLVDWLMPILSQKRKLEAVMDFRMKGQYSSEAMLLTAQLTLKCLQSSARNRPSMKEVIDALKQIDAIKDKQV